ncbi:hypothetical protein [Nonomuraea sp. NPDC052265]|uniref:hypothetical protein n=1 Tax=Nonomuraea sp. NPDC052265 TaxID=3364374 RepID=UPI0037CBB5FD
MTHLPPAQARADVHVTYHQILVGEPGRDHPGTVPNGLTASAPGAAVIRTGIHTGVVDVTVRLAGTAQPPDPEGWEESEEVEFVTTTGVMRVQGVADEPIDLTPQGAGRYGLRVHGRRRDRRTPSNQPSEVYLLVVWPVALGAAAAG